MQNSFLSIDWVKNIVCILFYSRSEDHDFIIFANFVEELLTVGTNQEHRFRLLYLFSVN